MEDFKKLILRNTPNVYLEMQRGETKSPYIFQPEKICEHDSYRAKRDRYVKRIHKEKEAFNDALQTIIKSRKTRLRLEEQRRNKRQRRIEAFFFSLPQLLITLICILPIGFLDYVRIKFIAVKIHSEKWVGYDDFVKTYGLPMFLGNVLQIPLWIGVTYIVIAHIIRKISKAVYNEKNYKKYAQSRWIIMLVLSIVESITSFLGDIL